MRTPAFKTCFFSAILTVGLFVSSASADMVNPLFGIAATYNDVFFGDYFGRNGDIEGHAAIKGNVDVSAYAFGSGEQNLHPNSQSPTLVVGGNVTSSSSSVYDGDAYIAGALIPQPGQNKWNTLSTAGTGPYNTVDPGYNGTPGTVYVAGTPDADLDYQYQKNTTASIPFDFDAAEAQLRKVSTDLFGLQDTVHAGFVGANYTVDLTGLSGLQVVTIDTSVFDALGRTNNIYITAGADTTLIINITDNGNLGVLNLQKEFIINGSELPGYGDFDGSNILINTDLALVDIRQAAINASLLALDAHIMVEHGNIDGQAFGASAWTMNGGEFHAYYTFDDKHFSGGGTATVPEPATCVIIACGLIGLGYTQRRRLFTSQDGA